MRIESRNLEEYLGVVWGWIGEEVLDCWVDDGGETEREKEED